jgi:lambda family phage tail tape measure protein
LLRAQLKRNVALEQEIAARKQATSEAEKLAAFQDNQASKLSQAQDGLNSQLTGLGRGDKLRERLKEDLAIRKEYQSEVDKLNKQLNIGQISEDLYQQETDILEENLASRLVMQQDYYNQVDEAQSNFFLGASEGWANWAEEASDYSAQAAEFVTGSLDALSDGLADTFMSILDGTKSVGDAFSDLAATLVKEIIGALVKMAAQWIVYQGVVLLTGKATQASAATALVANAQATAFQASLAAFASTAAIPIVGPILAPAAAASAAAFAAPLVAGVATASLAGMAHDGIDSIPETGTWLLQKGERVTTASTSAKLDKTLEDVQKSRTGSQAPQQTVNIIEDASKAGQTRTRLDDDGVSQLTEVFVSQIYGDGPIGEAMQNRFGLRGQGQ